MNSDLGPVLILLGLFLGSMSSRALTRSWRPCFPPVAHGTPTLKRSTGDLNARLLLHQSHDQWRRLIRARDLFARSSNNFESLPQTHEASLWNSRYVCPFARLCSCVSEIKWGIRHTSEKSPMLSSTGFPWPAPVQTNASDEKVGTVRDDSRINLECIMTGKNRPLRPKAVKRDSHHAYLRMKYSLLNPRICFVLSSIY